MVPALYWINSPWGQKLAISARPRGGDWLEDEVSGWSKSGVDVVVSLLTSEEERDLQLNQEAALARAQKIEFLSLPILDRGIPEKQVSAIRFIGEVRDRLDKGHTVAIHCRQGIGRSGMIAVALLVSNGISLGAALQEVSAARGLTVPETAEQAEWVKQFAAAEAALPRR